AWDIQLKVPRNWIRHQTDNGVSFQSEAQSDQSAVFAMIKKASATTFTEAGMQAMLHTHPKDWVNSPANFGNKPAIKIVGSDIKDPSRRMVQYFIPASDGYYVIYLLAPFQSWKSYTPLFNNLIKSAQFSN